MRQGGSDVITKTALKRINWGNYKIAQNTDKVGVFVSIVSTRIPYKGAGKEYIGGAACVVQPCQQSFAGERPAFGVPLRFSQCTNSAMLSCGVAATPAVLLQRTTWRSWCTP